MEGIDYPRSQFAVCDTCGLKHLCMTGSLQAIDFFARHHGHALRLEDNPDPVLFRLHAQLGVDLFRELHHVEREDGRERQRIVEIDRLGFMGYVDNADVKEALGTTTSMTITNANLASSATAGWQSDAIDNTTNLYLDYLFMFAFAAVNTPPGNNQAINFYEFGLVDSTGSVYTSTGAATPSGSEGTLTYPNITTLPVVAPLLGIGAYPVQNVPNNYGPFSYLAPSAFRVAVPPKIAIGMVNFSNMTLSVTTIKYRGQYITVV